MISNKQRNGSALLIVLGMVAFMIVSAVGFASYMRYSRLPSSYLRRANTSRQLVKAGLSQAMDMIDRAINNNPYPGVGTQFVPEEDSDTGLHRNIWVNNVFMNTNVQVTAENVKNLESNNNVVDFDATVPTLTLEALGYLPPALINKVRITSRRTNTAVWRPLNFDAGRFAFTAVNVSDCLDVNRLLASYRRSSSPNGRVSIAHLFEDSSHTSAGNGAAWDSFMNQYRDFNENKWLFDYGSKMPFLSMMDFNLALGFQGSVGQIVSPFYNLIKQGSNGDRVYPGDNLELYGSMMFLTDSWMAPYVQTGNPSDASSVAYSPFAETYDLTDSQYQPFTMSELSGDNQLSLMTIIGKRNDFQERISSDANFSISKLGMAALCDYLDENNIPASLAIPTTERVPMICGIDFGTIQGGDVKISKQRQVSVSSTIGPSQRKVKVVDTYRLDGTALKNALGQLALRAMFVSPFNHDDGLGGGNFTVDGAFRLILAEEGLGLRTGSIGAASATKSSISENGFRGSGIYQYPMQSQSLGMNSIQDEIGAVKTLDWPLVNAVNEIASGLSGNNFLLQVEYNELTQTLDEGGGGGGTTQGGWEPDVEGNAYLDPRNWTSINTVSSGINAMKTTGEALPLADGNINVNLRFSLGVTLRVKDGNNTVDLVPACIADDNEFNGINNEMAAPLLSGVSGNSGPLFKVDLMSSSMNVSISGLDEMAKNNTPITVTASQPRFFVGDPRFNHAPENWFSTTANFDAQGWLDYNGTGGNGKDGDIFMAVSDQCYLQSIYELMMLPNFAPDQDNGGSDITVGNLAGLGSYSGITATKVEDTPQYNFMWRSYGIDDHFLYRGFTSAGNGLKVNPYSESSSLLMTAFANTPLDWTCASTNDQTNASGGSDLASQFNSKYAWNEYSQGGKIEWDTLKNIAANLNANVRSITDASKNWEDAFYSTFSGTFYNDTQFGGANLGNSDTLYDVDRKFLYGFWHDCFDVRQQLFLIFVRAEPAMMGGEIAGQTPPQLGARAVALVWRDPSPSSASGITNPDGRLNGYPHRMRILFYKQLE